MSKGNLNFSVSICGRADTGRDRFSCPATAPASRRGGATSTILINMRHSIRRAQYIAVHSARDISRMQSNTLFYMILLVSTFFDRSIRTRMHGLAEADTDKFCTVLSTESVHNSAGPIASPHRCAAPAAPGPPCPQTDGASDAKRWRRSSSLMWRTSSPWTM